MNTKDNKKLVVKNKKLKTFSISIDQTPEETPDMISGVPIKQVKYTNKTKKK